MKYERDFQVSMLSFMLTSENGLNYLRECPETIFADNILEAIMRASKMYLEKYIYRPSKVHLKAYLDKDIGLDPKYAGIKPLIYKAIDDVYEPLSIDIKFIEDSIVEFIQFNLTDKLFEKYSYDLHLKSNTDANVYYKIQREMADIVNLHKTLEPDKYQHLFLSKISLKELQNSISRVFPTCFLKINEAQSAGGFTPKEIVVFVAGPKAGKTTLLVNLTNGFVRQGFKVLYIDTENGVDRIMKLSVQQFLKCTHNEIQTSWKLKSTTDIESVDFIQTESLLYNDFGLSLDEIQSLRSKYYYNINDLIKSYMPQILALGGDLKVEYISTNGTIDTVYNICEKLQRVHNFVPDIIVCDYFDNMTSNRVSKSDRRFIIQDLYKVWKDLAVSLDCAVFTVSQTNRQAYEKPMLEAIDVGEDYAKIANADSIWGFSRSKEDRANSLAVISPIANRNGSDNSSLYTFNVKVDSARCNIIDLYAEELQKQLLSDDNNNSNDFF